MSQILVKAILTIVILAVPLWVVVRVWFSNINVEGLAAYFRGRIEEKTAGILREENALYQAGEIVATVEGVTVKEQDKLVHFKRVTGRINFLAPGPEPIIFRGFQLQARQVENMTGSPPTPYLYEDARV